MGVDTRLNIFEYLGLTLIIKVSNFGVALSKISNLVLTGAT